jgi:hypothetical protein
MKNIILKIILNSMVFGTVFAGIIYFFKGSNFEETILFCLAFIITLLMNKVLD